MKEIIINKAMNHIKKKGNYSEEKLAEINEKIENINYDEKLTEIYFIYKYYKNNSYFYTRLLFRNY